MPGRPWATRHWCSEPQLPVNLSLMFSAASFTFSAPFLTAADSWSPLPSLLSWSSPVTSPAASLALPPEVLGLVADLVVQSHSSLLLFFSVGLSHFSKWTNACTCTSEAPPRAVVIDSTAASTGPLISS